MSFKRIDLKFAKSKKGSLLLSLAIIAITLIALTAVTLRSYVKVYPYSVFSSAYFEKEEEKSAVDREDINGVFTYGPYISLTRGSYQGTVEYECDRERTYELTSDYSSTRIASGLLDPNKTRLSFTFTIDKDISDNSVEFRTMYGAAGTLNFKSLTLSRRGWQATALGICLLYVLTAVLSAFLLKRLDRRVLLYSAAYYLVLHEGFSRGIWQATALAALHVAFLAALIYRKKKAQDALVLTIREITVAVLGGFLFAASFLLYQSPGATGTLRASAFAAGTYVTMIIVAAHLILLVLLLTNRPLATDLLMLLCAYAFGALCVRDMKSAVSSDKVIYLTIGVSVILGFFTYAVFSRAEETIKAVLDRAKSYKIPFLFVCAAMFACIVFISYQTIARHRGFGSSCFDFGIFAQMYEYMARTGMPLTTCERGYLLSHFYIHFSPIYYVFLPVYMLFRTPDTLLVIQAAITFGAAIPVYLLCKEYGLAPIIAAVAACIYLALPAIVQPLYYDFHENTFMPFFMLWFIYFFRTKKDRLALLFLLLSLMIKEEAAIYLFFIELFFLLIEREWRRAGLTMVITLAYFIAVMIFIQSHGLGLMEGHYGMYYLPGESGTLAMAKNILQNPSFFIRNVFAEDNFAYIYYTLGALAFVPLINKDWRRLILLIPFVAFGLMTTYVYQHDIGYQYTYGIAVLMVFGFIVNLKELPVKWHAILAMLCLCTCMLLNYTYRGTGFFGYGKTYSENKEQFDSRDQLLKTIPKDASVFADTYYLPHLYDVAELYLYDNNRAEEIDSDYVVLVTGQDYSFREIYEAKGYELECSEESVDIFKKKAA